MKRKNKREVELSDTKQATMIILQLLSILISKVAILFVVLLLPTENARALDLGKRFT